MTRVFGLLFILVLEAVPAMAQHGDALDDVLEHLPMATAIGLSACGAGGDHTLLQTLGHAAASYAVGTAATYTLKHAVSEERPDHSDRRSFPSGHATYAFASAAVLRHEYGHVSPWVAASGYAVAVLTAADRVRRDRHHWYDVCAGAAIGTVATEATYYVSQRWLKGNHAAVAFNGCTVRLAYRW